MVVEDIGGTSSVWAGGTSAGAPGPSADSRRKHLREATHGHAFRENDRLVAVACPDGEVLGAISLIDPGGEAGEVEAFALEQAATVLAMELFRLRSIAEAELKVWGDLTTELLDNDDLAGKPRPCRRAGLRHRPSPSGDPHRPGPIPDRRAAVRRAPHRPWLPIG